MFYLTTHSTHFIYGYMASEHDNRDFDLNSTTKVQRNHIPQAHFLYDVRKPGLIRLITYCTTGSNSEGDTSLDRISIVLKENEKFITYS